MNTRLASIYLQDHLAGALGGVELARRAAASNRGHERYGSELAEIHSEILEDRRSLEAVMERIGTRPNPVKQGSAWVAEKVGRMKLNGRLTGYSPLSRLVEIEGLVVGVSGKLELWRSLRAADGNVEGIDLARLIARAESQRERLEKLHDAAAAEALSD